MLGILSTVYHHRKYSSVVVEQHLTPIQMTEQPTSRECEDWTSLEETITPDPVELPPTPTVSATVEPEGSPSQELLLDPDTQETPNQDDGDFSCVRKQCRDRPQSSTYTIRYTERGGRKRVLKICGYCSTGWQLDENLNPLGKRCTYFCPFEATS